MTNISVIRNNSKNCQNIYTNQNRIVFNNNLANVLEKKICTRFQN